MDAREVWNRREDPRPHSTECGRLQADDGKLEWRWQLLLQVFILLRRIVQGNFLIRFLTRTFPPIVESLSVEADCAPCLCLVSCSLWISSTLLCAQAVGPWGFNFWAHSSKLCNNGKGCDAVAMVGQCAANGGPKWITAEAAYYAMDPQKKGRTWHPTAGMHLLRGEVLAYNYVQMLADAIFTVEEDLKKKTPHEAAKGKGVLNLGTVMR